MMSLVMGCLVSCKEEDPNEFVVGFDAEFPPYGYKDDNGEYVGFDLSLAEEVCKRNGWTLKKQPIDWDSKDMELKSGTIDCIWNGFTINGRENIYTWSKAYVDNSQVVIVKAKSGIDSLDDLKGKVVIVQTDSSALAAFEGANATEANKALRKEFKDLQQVSDYNSAFMSLESGIADAVCMDMGVANYQLALRGNEFKMLKEQVATEQYGIGFKLGNEELRDKVEGALNEMVDDGIFMEIAEKYGLETAVCYGK
jgi:polar amino acid transport system substrate-binding protein